MVDWDAYYRERGEKTASEEAEERARVGETKKSKGYYRRGKGKKVVGVAERYTVRRTKRKKRKGKKKGVRSFRKGVVSAFGFSKARVRF